MERLVQEARRVIKEIRVIKVIQGAAGSGWRRRLSGFEMVFLRNNSATAPAAISTTAAQRTTNDFVPTGWSDDPVGVTQANQYEWVAIRTGTSGAWSEFSTPSACGLNSARMAHLAQQVQMAQGIRWRGAWSSTTAYVINDIVRNDGKAWVCINAHTGDEPS